MDSDEDTPKGGLPHSEIRGSAGARPSPRLFAACHVLPRLSMPRHPPNALTSLVPLHAQGIAPPRFGCRLPDVGCRSPKGPNRRTQPPIPFRRSVMTRCRCPIPDAKITSRRLTSDPCHLVNVKTLFTCQSAQKTDAGCRLSDDSPTGFRPQTLLRDPSASPRRPPRPPPNGGGGRD